MKAADDENHSVKGNKSLSIGIYFIEVSVNL